MVKFLTAGTFSKIKGQDVLAAAIRMLPDEYMKKAEFSFCGNEAAVDEEVYTSVCELEKDYNNVHMLHQLTRQQTISCMEDADCPDQICVNHRAISRDGESIICLPNQTIVTIRGGEEPEVDEIAR